MARLKEEVLGHDLILKRLWEATSKDRLPHAMLFLGPSGIGKKKAALAVAQRRLCENNSACGDCPSCKRVFKHQHENLLIIEPETTQVKIDQIRRVHEFCRLKLMGKARVIIVDEAQSMNPQAANSLLKLLEEPPANHHFILITHQEAGILPTIRSRSQVFRFAPLSLENMQKLTDARPWALRAAQGRMDRLDILKDPETEEQRRYAVGVLEAALDGDLFNVSQFLKPVLENKKTALFGVQIWQTLLRDMWVLRSESDELINPDARSILEKGNQISEEQFDIFWGRLLEVERDINGNVEKNLVAEHFWTQFSKELRP